MTSMGKYRHLSRASTSEGHFCVLAIDHRTNLLEGLEKQRGRSVSDAEFADFKRLVVAGLLSEASALLIDPAYGLGPGISGRFLSAHAGLLAPVEVTDYDLHPSKREVNFIPNWSVGKMKRVGVDGVKLLLPYHPEAANVEHKHAIVRQIVDACGHYDIPFYLEPIAYSLDETKPLDNHELPQIVAEMARIFSTMQVDVLKMEFPYNVKEDDDETAWRQACDMLDAASTVPWALLSAGVDYATFARQARVACEAGASGVIVGRAVWAEAVRLEGQAAADFIHTSARERMQELAAIVRQSARPWHERVDAPAGALNWYEDYAEL